MNPEEQAPAGEIPPIEATNSNVCSPDDQSTNVCNPEEQAPAGEIPPISGGSRCLVDLWISAFLPPYDEKGRLHVPPAPPPFSSDYYQVIVTDDRNTPVKGGSARLWSYLVVDLCTQSGNQVITKIHGIGVSHGWMHSYSGLEGDEDPVIDESPAGPVVEEIARASAEDMYEDVNSKHDYGDGSVFVTVVGDASIPLIPHAPAINYEFQIKLIPQFSSFNSQEKGPSTMSSVLYDVTGSHDGFPAYEVFIGKSNVYFHTPKESEGQSAVNPFNSGQTLSSLFPPMEIDVSKHGILSADDAIDKNFVPPKSTQEPLPITRVRVHDTNDENLY